MPEDGALPVAQVSDAVQLDEIFRAFDPETRAAFQAWMQGQAAALRGRGDDLSLAIASLDPFAQRGRPRAATARLAVRSGLGGCVRSGGEVFGALSERPGQLRGLIENANTVFETTARRNEDLATAFEIFPTFLRESRATLARLETVRRRLGPGRAGAAAGARASSRRRSSRSVASRRSSTRSSPACGGRSTPRRRARGRFAGCSTTTCRRCSSASTPSSPSSTRSSR